MEYLPQNMKKQRFLRKVKVQKLKQLTYQNEKRIANKIAADILKNHKVLCVSNHDIPDKVFIVPYRDRNPHKMVFINVMPQIIKHLNYEIFFIHQQDSRQFNRGAMKNIGFLHAKEKWPNHYKNMTFIFHDIDSISYYKDQFTFDTVPGVINHFFGYKHTLGGIFAIKGSDFEKVGGFPNIWNWGGEDNIFLDRVKQFNMRIIYPQFIQASDNVKNMIYLWHGWNRPNLTNKLSTVKRDFKKEIFKQIKNIKKNNTIIVNKINMLNITNFDTLIKKIYKIRQTDSRKN